MQRTIRRTLILPGAFESAACVGPPLVRRETLCAAVLCAAALLAAPAAFGQNSRYDAAHVDYEIGHYAQAFEVFASLADEGHCDAARLAQQMARYGRPVYAVDFKVASERLERWQRLPACPAAVAVHSAERRAP